ncbi:MAG: hypothetical protein J7L23_00280 [Candidatus Diapherotrites archaeon]|nr:hypothetical protein [Candidatus Diapherotrites archaeon]
MGSIWDFIKDSIDKSKSQLSSIAAILLITFILGELYGIGAGTDGFWYPWWLLVIVLVFMVLNELLSKPAKEATPKS